MCSIQSSSRMHTFKRAIGYAGLMIMPYQRRVTESEGTSLHDHLHGIGEFLRGMQKSIDSIENRVERMEANMDEQFRAMERSVEALRSSLEHHVDSGVGKKADPPDHVPSKVDSQYDGIERRLDKIAFAVGIRNVVSAGDDNEDRKRLKMRLKEALTIQNANDDRVSVAEPEGYLEYFLGIRPPNGRIGKQGSRYGCGWA
jgi:hypothetical protein